MANKKTQRVGSRSKVMHGTAVMTAGGLKKEDLMYSKAGRIVSKKRHATMKRKMDS